MDLNSVIFDFMRNRENRRKIYSILFQQAFCGVDQVFAYFYFPPTSSNNKEDGWKVCDLEKEYNRMLITAHLYSNTNNNINEFTLRWRISNVNLHYALCESYPKKVDFFKNISHRLLIFS